MKPDIVLTSQHQIEDDKAVINYLGTSLTDLRYVHINYKNQKKSHLIPWSLVELMDIKSVRNAVAFKSMLEASRQDIKEGRYKDIDDCLDNL